VQDADTFLMGPPRGFIAGIRTFTTRRFCKRNGRGSSLGHRSQVTHGFEHQVLRKGKVHFAIRAAFPSLRQQFIVFKQQLSWNLVIRYRKTFVLASSPILVESFPRCER
jgi:hypothetical protein